MKTAHAISSRFLGLALGGIAVSVACGNTTSLGHARGGPDGSAAASGAGGTPGSDAAGGSDSGTAGASVGGSAGNAGNAGAGGSSTATGGSGAQGGAAPLPCNVPKPPPNPNPTPVELERAALVHDLCLTLQRDDCLGNGAIGSMATGCGREEQLLACEYDQLHTISQLVPECEDAWRTAITCLTNVTYTRHTCYFGWDLGGQIVGGTVPCQEEKEAYIACYQANPLDAYVGGAVTRCSYGPSDPWLGDHDCQVHCEFEGNYFSSVCTGPPGLPLRCLCAANGVPLLGFITGDDDGTFFVSDCREAAQLMADGECVDRLSCCIEYEDGSNHPCLCGADASALGEPSCDALAESLQGRVVDRCPKYDPHCWPPPCN